MTDLSAPHVVQARLEQIEQELALRQNAWEAAASGWFAAQREIRKVYATALLTAEESSVTEKKAHADIAAHAVEGAEHEAEYEAMRAVIKMLETRATICMSILKSQGRG